MKKKSWFTYKDFEGIGFKNESVENYCSIVCGKHSFGPFGVEVSRDAVWKRTIFESVQKARNWKSRLREEAYKKDDEIK